MAKYQVTHSCGHVETVKLYGKHDERQKNLEWMEQRLCNTCWNAEKERAREIENERVEAVAERLGFVKLRGTPKQNAWAMAIRQAVYEAAVKDNAVVNAEMAAKVICLEKMAKWWIDYRYESPRRIFRVIAGNYPTEYKEIEENIYEKL